MKTLRIDLRVSLPFHDGDSANETAEWVAKQIDGFLGPLYTTVTGWSVLTPEVIVPRSSGHGEA